jgi:hypothetical protein
MIGGVTIGDRATPRQLPLGVAGGHAVEAAATITKLPLILYRAAAHLVAINEPF